MRQRWQWAGWLGTAIPVAFITVLVGAVAAALVRMPAREPVADLGKGLVMSVIALCAGVLVARGGARTAPGVATFRRWLAAAMSLWGLGQLVRCVHAATVTERDDGFPTLGDVISLGAAPLVVIGLAVIPRRFAASTSAVSAVVRMLLDAGLLAVAASLVTWRLLFTGAGAPALDAVRVATALAVLLEIVVCAVVVVTALRDPTAAVLALSAGLLCFVLSALVLLRSAGALAPPNLAGQVLWVAVWPLACWGILRYDPRARSAGGHHRSEADPDARATLVTTVVSLILLVVGGASLVVRSPASARIHDPVTLSIVLAVIGLLGVRELYNTRLRLRLIARLQEEATSDPLTGLANRRLLTTRLADVRPGEDWCLVALDLDRFKGVNDLLGQGAGDRLLRAVADRLVRSKPAAASVFRTGGDEFAVLLPGRMSDGLVAAEVVLAAVRRAGCDGAGSTRLPVTASVGVTVVQNADPLSALSAVGAAVAVAKNGGRDRIEVYEGATAQARARRLAIEERLRAAIQSGDLTVHFQPVVDLNTGALVGVEALARWSDPVLGTIDPREFIPVAEQTGLVVGLGQLVLARAVEQATRYGLPQRGIQVACNVSPLQLCVAGFPKLVEAVLARYSMPPGLLLVEVTEAVLVEEDGPAVRALHRLAEAGVTIAIDDFGTGYSALGYLRRLPAHALKIDRSLTCALKHEPEARAITRAVIDLGASLGVAIIVEGIETSDVAELVTAMGAGHGQGNLYGQPMPMADVMRLGYASVSARQLA